MTLVKQLLTIMLTLFAIVFIGTFVISVNSYQIISSAQDTLNARQSAKILGQALAPALINNNMNAVNATIKNIFDSGFYQKIWLSDGHDKTILTKQSSLNITHVPAWFVHLFPLQMASAESVIMSGQKPLGKIHLVSNLNYSYEILWKNIIKLLLWFLLMLFIITIAGIVMLRVLFKPLNQIRMQAIAVYNHKFIINEKLPRSHDLRAVVEAMNYMIKKLQKIFKEQMLLTEELQQQAFCDPVTGLGNRRFMNNQLQHMVMNPEEFYKGSFLLIGINDLKAYNKIYGYVSGDKLLKSIANELQRCSSAINQCYLAHLSGGTFAVLIPDITMEQITKYAENICNSLKKLLASHEMTDNNIAANIGIANFFKGISTTELLSTADLALREAELRGPYTYEYHSNIDKPSTHLQGATKWREWLQKIIEYNEIILHFQPVVQTHNKSLFHYEALLRIRGEDGKLLTAGAFIPMAENLGLMHEFDKLVIKQLINLVIKNPNDYYAVNISRDSLHNSNFLNWLKSELMNIGSAAANIIVEVSESLAINNLPLVTKLADDLNHVGSSLALDHLGRSFSRLSYLSKLRLAYIKLDGSYATDISENHDIKLFVRSLVEVAHAVDIQVIAENVENDTQRELFAKLNFDGLQGNLLGLPQAMV